MANIRIIATIEAAGDFPVVLDDEVKGGMRSVATSADRNAITQAHRKEGMLVYVRDVDIFYKLEADLLSWTETLSGSGSGATGATGPRGPAGPPGMDGADGVDGPIGVAGATGPRGATGATGTDGSTANVVDNTQNGLAPQTHGAASEVLVDDNVGEPLWRQLTQDDILPAFVPHLSGGGTVEVGATVSTPSFTGSYTSGPPTSATFSDTDGNAPFSLSTPFTAISDPYSFTKSANGASVTFTLSATKGAITRNTSVSYQWLPRVYWGTDNDGLNSESGIEGLANNALASGRQRTFNVNALSGKHIYYGYPASYGAATFTVGGFEGGFDLVSATISVTNAQGVTQNYRLYKSTNPSLGDTTVVVT